MNCNRYLSGFAKSYVQDFLATVSLVACSVLGHFFSYDAFSTKKPLTNCSRQEDNVFIMLFPSPPPLPPPIISYQSLCVIKHC